MISVFLTQLTKEKRNPLMLILFIAASIGVTIIFSGGTQAPTTVAIFSEEENARPIETRWEKLLNESGEIEFVIADPEETRENVQQGQADLAVKVTETDYRIIASSSLPMVPYVEQHVRSIFEQEAVIQHAVNQAARPEAMRSEIESRLVNPPLQMNVSNLEGNELAGYHMGTQLMFAFTLLVAMFMIGFRINNLLKDKVYGLWDRMILSPVTKTGMYTAYIAYAFCIGLFQILIVIMIFKYGLDYDIGGRLDLLLLILTLFTFSMVSIATLLTGLVKKPEQFYAIYPSVIPLIPLISGAYMPPGTISNPVLLFIADLFPVAHAMEAIIDVVMYDAILQDILQPLVFMLLIGVIAMGIGVNLVERRTS